MVSHRARILCLSVGTALVLSALGARTVTDQSPHSTHRDPSTAATPLTPMNFGLLPGEGKKPLDDSTAVDYYVNPCLIPLPEIREITDQPLLFESKRRGEGLTSNVADARVSSAAPAFDFPLCTLTTDVNSVKLEFGIGVKHETKEQFRAHKQHNNVEKLSATVETSLHGLPGATAALIRYSHTGTYHEQQIYSELSVHTRSGYTVSIVYGTMDAQKLRRLATAALSTLDGSRYGINK